MEFVVPPLPYSKDALEPVMKQETLEYHYEKHHKGYMAKLKELLGGKPEAEQPLEQVIKNSTGGVFNNAAQVYNHTFFWDGLKPGGGGAPPAGDVADLVQRDFGGWDMLREQWATRGMGRFGSGYVWLVISDGKAKILDTPNAETPLTMGATPLLTTDVWEHAYYLDHRNNRKAFLDVFCDRLINWEFVAHNLKNAK
jgi:Fe-Mn family superoxide dismutase